MFHGRVLQDTRVFAARYMQKSGDPRALSEPPNMIDFYKAASPYSPDRSILVKGFSSIVVEAYDHLSVTFGKNAVSKRDTAIF